jgi:hypothetical protein
MTGRRYSTLRLSGSAGWASCARSGNIAICHATGSASNPHALQSRTRAMSWTCARVMFSGRRSIEQWVN